MSSKILQRTTSCGKYGFLWDVYLIERVHWGVKSWTVKFDAYMRDRHLVLTYDDEKTAIAFYYSCIKDCYIDEKRLKK